MSRNLIRRSLAVAGVAALALGVAADVAAVAAQSAGGHLDLAPFATRAESIKLAKRLLAKAVLPPGTRRFLGRKLPAVLHAPPQETSLIPTIDVHRVFSEPLSMQRTADFLAHHHPAGWIYEGSGSSGDEYSTTEEDVSYAPRHLRAAFREIDMLVEVAEARNGRALARVDIQVVWSQRKPEADYLVARQVRAVRIEAWSYGPNAGHRKRTFRQRAIIDKLSRVLNPLPIAPSSPYSCHGYAGPTVQLTFEPVKGRPVTVVTAIACPSGYAISIGRHSEPALVDNGKIEKIADKLLRGSHQPNR